MMVTLLSYAFQCTRLGTISVFLQSPIFKHDSRMPSHTRAYSVGVFQDGSFSVLTGHFNVPATLSQWCRHVYLLFGTLQYGTFLANGILEEAVLDVTKPIPSHSRAWQCRRTVRQRFTVSLVLFDSTKTDIGPT